VTPMVQVDGDAVRGSSINRFPRGGRLGGTLQAVVAWPVVAGGRCYRRIRSAAGARRRMEWTGGLDWYACVRACLIWVRAQRTSMVGRLLFALSSVFVPTTVRYLSCRRLLLVEDVVW
jgi:hypothetical protein